MTRSIEPCLCGDPECGRCFPKAPRKKPRYAYFTPGPWCIDAKRPEAEDPRDPSLDIMGGPDGETIVACAIGGLEMVEQEANARLIAAAPELLAALEGLLDQLDGIGIPEWHGAEGLYLDEARKIAKVARGR